MPEQNKCPKCGRPVVKLEEKLYRCDECKMLTDCEDDGVVGYGDPERFASRDEEYQQRKTARKKRQRQPQQRRPW